MRVRSEPGKMRAIVAALFAAGWLALGSNLVSAQSEIIDELLEKLKDKGVLSDDEYQALKKAREEERLEQRAERRRQALKAAQDTEKEEKAKQATKVDINPGIRGIQLFGDLRLRYESRAGSSSFAIPGAGGPSMRLRTAGAMPPGSAFAEISRTTGSTGCVWIPARTRVHRG